MAGEGQNMPSWINKDFILRSLREENENLSVISYEVKKANAEGDGYSSDMFRITAKLSDSEERRLIVKCHPDKGVREALMVNMNTFNKEMWMYSETLPVMNRLLQQAFSEQTQPIGAKCLYYGNEPLKFLVLEDLQRSGFVMAKRQQGLDLAHCSLVMQHLARFHAASLALHEKIPTALEHYNESAFREQSKPQGHAYLVNAVNLLAKEVLTWPGYEKYAQKLEDLKDVFFDRIVELSKRKEEYFNVLIHGDCWTNNMLFRYSGNTPKDLRFVDFQLSHYTSPALDLQYFLFTSPSDEVRITHMDSLIQKYHTTLTDTLIKLGCSKKLSLSQLQKGIKEHAFYGIFAAIAIMPLVLRKTDDDFDLEKSLSTDSNVEGNRSVYSNEVYVEALKRMFPIFEEAGVL